MRERRHTTLEPPSNTSTFKPSYDIFDNQIVRNATFKGESDSSTFRRVSRNDVHKKPFLFDELIAETVKNKRGLSKHFKDFPTERENFL